MSNLMLFLTGALHFLSCHTEHKYILLFDYGVWNGMSFYEFFPVYEMEVIARLQFEWD